MSGHASAPGSRDLPAETADVIVVGAGPAGSSAALRLAQAGLDVLVLGAVISAALLTAALILNASGPNTCTRPMGTACPSSPIPPHADPGRR